MIETMETYTSIRKKIQELYMRLLCAAVSKLLLISIGIYTFHFNLRHHAYYVLILSHVGKWMCTEIICSCKFRFFASKFGTATKIIDNSLPLVTCSIHCHPKTMNITITNFLHKGECLLIRISTMWKKQKTRMLSLNRWERSRVERWKL